MSDIPVITQKSPYPVELEEGKNYAWCRCGRSQNQPFCDGAHKQTDMLPLTFKAEKSGRHFLCGCKHSRNAPFCDGTHNDL